MNLFNLLAQNSNDNSCILLYYMPEVRNVGLKKQRPVKRLAIFWDGASYHNSQEFREYLILINQENPKKNG